MDPLGVTGAWSFGGETPPGFDDHVSRSIPWYAACHELVVELADHLVPAHGRCYELGCSTGTLTALLARRLEPREAEVIGLDAEPGMLELARERCAALQNVSRMLMPSPPCTRGISVLPTYVRQPGRDTR